MEREKYIGFVAVVGVIQIAYTNEITELALRAVKDVPKGMYGRIVALFFFFALPITQDSRERIERAKDVARQEKIKLLPCAMLYER